MDARNRTKGAIYWNRQDRSSQAWRGTALSAALRAAGFL